jgi:uncharacterized caspase-like protein
MGTRSAGVGRGLGEVETGVGTFIAYSTQPGNVALDGAGRNSPFTAALSKAVRQPGRSLSAVMIDVRKEVLAATAGKQVPWDHSALTGDFYFLFPALGTLPQPALPAAGSEAMQRLKALEEEVKRKSDQQQTLRLVDLAQRKERLRQLDEASRADQQRIFDTYRKYGPASDATSREALNREIGSIQMQMAQRGLQQKALRDDIARLEEEAGLAKKGEGEAQK